MIIFYTDPHLGLSRTSNTTPSSARELQQALYTQAWSVVRDVGSYKVCLGDMLDRFSNPEEVQAQALRVIANTDLTLSGNHDVVNQADKVGTLRFLSNVLYAYAKQDGITPFTKCVFAKFGEPHIHVESFDKDKVTVVGVPHVADQSLFEKSLAMAAKAAEKTVTGHTLILCLHCNFDMPEERLTETSLNLTRQAAINLLSSFHYVLLGHEHAPSDHFDGRLVIVGNTHPTGMADISDKRVLEWVDGELRSRKIWDASVGYAEYDHREIPHDTKASFVRIKGDVASGDMLDLTRNVSALWKRSPNLYCVKLDVSMATLSGSDQKRVQRSMAQLPDLIRKELEPHQHMLELWDRLLEEEQEEVGDA